MAAYAYPIRIERGFKTLTETREIEIEQPLTLDELMTYVEHDDKFSIIEGSVWQDGCVLVITSKRSETAEERDRRVEREERYMAEYNRKRKQCLKR